MLSYLIKLLSGKGAVLVAFSAWEGIHLPIGKGSLDMT